jgi:phospholipase/carboxylesterase
MHGLGADCNDFASIVPQLDRPNTKFVFPSAPTIPVTINFGYVMPAWYDILSMEWDVTGERESSEGILKSAEMIDAVISKEINSGVKSSRIVIAGFSQGGAMALHVGLRFLEKLAGIMVLSGYLVLPESTSSEKSKANENTPLLFCHGIYDPTVPLSFGKKAFNFSNNEQDGTLFCEYPMGHEVCMPEIEQIKDWLAMILD